MDRQLVSLFVVALFLAACGPRPQPVSKAEAQDLAAKIERTMAARNAKVLDGLLDADLLTERLQRASKTSVGRDMKTGIQNAMHRVNIGTQILRAEPEGVPHYQLVKLYSKAGEMHAIFRAYGRFGINYHDYELVKKAGKVRAADVFVYVTGENLSQTMAGLMETANNSGASASKTVRAMRAVRTALNEDDPEEAMRRYRSIPADYKSDKTVKLIYINICDALGNDSLRAVALEDYMASYPASSNIALLMIDTYIGREEWEKALDAIEVVDSMINRDPFLDYFRGNIVAASGDDRRAAVFYEYMHKALPDFEDGFLELINNCILRKDKARADALIAEYRRNPKLHQDVLSNLLQLYPAYAGAS